MGNILKQAGNAEQLLKLTADTMILLDKDGNCVDIAVYNTDLWFLKEDKILGRNLFKLLPLSTYNQIHPEFERVLTYKVRSTRNYQMTMDGITYFFKCIMNPFKGMVLCQYRDITERSQRKLELEKKNRELSEIQKAALIGRWKYGSVNNRFSFIGHTEIMCTNEEQSISLDTYTQYILSEDYSAFQNWMELNLKGDMAHSLDYRIRYKGKICYIRVKAYSRERHRDGSIELEGYIQNITDIQQQRNDINLLTHAINSSTEDIYSASEDGTLLFANRRFRQRHHISETADVNQLKIFDLPSYGRDKQEWEKFVEKVKNKEMSQGYIINNPIRDNPNVLAIEANSNWVTSDEGLGTIWTFGRDISRRIRSEQQIKLFYKVLDKTIENLPAGIVVKDINDDFKYLYRNQESYNRKNVFKEVVGKNDFDCHPLEIAQEKRAQDVQVAQTGKEMHWIIEELDTNGNTIYLDKRKIKVESEDFAPILLSIEWDITETERMKRELLVAKEKAETSDRLKSAFLANMSHEIRTPLNAIVGFSRLITEAPDEKERKEYYEIVESNNNRLLQLINEILDLSKIESGIVEFNIAPIRLHSLCKEIYDAHIFRCPKEVELIFEPSDENIVIDGDKNRIFQVISNLVGNAFKFTTVGQISYGYHQEKDNIVFHVSDTGMGIARDKINRIFDRFIKVNDCVQGTGLGLCISKSIVERLGGSISVTSEIGKGTTFTFVLPIKSKEKKKSEETGPGIKVNGTEPATAKTALQPEREESAATAPEKATETVTGNHSILVAEDTDSNYALIQAILGQQYRLERAKDGMEAVAIFEEIHPDLILMDMKMPNLDGMDATRIIRELSPTIPIIALTAYAYEHDRKAAINAGCNDFLTKPFTQEALREAIVRRLGVKENSN